MSDETDRGEARSSDISSKTEWVKFGTALFVLAGVITGLLASKFVSEPSLRENNSDLRKQVEMLNTEIASLESQIQTREKQEKIDSSLLANKESTIETLFQQVSQLSSELGNEREKRDRANDAARQAIEYAGNAAKTLNRVDYLLENTLVYLQEDSPELAPVNEQLNQLNDVEQTFDQMLRFSESTTDDPTAGLLGALLSLGMKNSNQPYREEAMQRKSEIEARTAIAKLNKLEATLPEIRELIRREASLK